MSTLSPNMGLPVSTIGTDTGLQWEQNLNAAEQIIDSHDHSAGRGVAINPSGLNMNADLPMQNNNVTQVRAERFTPQGSPIPNSGADVGEIYVAGNELYYNDVSGGNQVQLTSNGQVNATSSGISDGTASAAFSAGTLQVKSSSTSYANVALQSVELSNSGNLSNQLTLEAPTLSGSYSLTLPTVPGSQGFVTLDTSGNFSGATPYPLQGTAMASQTITQGLLAPRATGSTVAAGGYATSTTVTSFSNSTTTYSSMASITITTTGRPVRLELMPAPGSTPGGISISGTGQIASGAFQIQGSTGAGSATFIVGGDFPSSSNQLNYPPNSIAFIDTPAAGTYTYTIYGKIISTLTGPGTIGASNVQLTAYEL